jgi:rhodanese-related sulfurtransferase
VKHQLVAFLVFCFAMVFVQTSTAQVRWPWQKELSWEQIDSMLITDFPDVQHVGIQAAAQLLKSSSPPLLVDARAPVEYAVSHLPGAVNLESVDALVARLGANTSQSVLIYCSVGIRSAQLARALKKRGYSNVQNMRGSIFAWANANLPLQSSLRAQSVDQPLVHPYSKRWSVLLDEAKRSAI